MVGGNSSKHQIVWGKRAIAQFRGEIENIRKESFQGAENVKKSILQSIDKIPEQPLRYPKDRFKKDNPGSYRAFELYKIRVAYKITNDKILILRVRHTKKEPLFY